MNILIYHQAPFRSVFLESKAEALKKEGHNVYFLTIGAEGSLHEYLRKLGVEAFCSNIDLNNGKSFFRQLFFLLSFIRKKKIDVVFSHLQIANLIALAANYFSKAKFIPCRHHIDVNMINGNKKSIFFDKINSFLAKKQVVVSPQAKEWMIEKESAKAKYIFPIPLGYNFAHYGSINQSIIEKIHKDLPVKLRLILVSRMVKIKRHDLAISIMADAKKKNLDLGLILIGDGPEKENLEQLTQKMGLTDTIKFYGFQSDVLSYLSAADIIIHPSISESSNQVIKEGAIAGITGIVCEGVGDFNDYLVDGTNAFKVSVEDTKEEMLKVLEQVYEDKAMLQPMARKLEKEVRSRFNITTVVRQYLDLVY